MLNSLSTRLLVITTLVMLCGNAGAAQPFVRGDANADGKLNLTDAVRTLKKLLVGGIELGS